MNTGSHGFTFNLKQVICKLGNPDIQSVVEPIEKIVMEKELLDLIKLQGIDAEFIKQDNPWY
jgi:hypothetical protein